MCAATVQSQLEEVATMSLKMVLDYCHRLEYEVKNTVSHDFSFDSLQYNRCAGIQSFLGPTRSTAFPISVFKKYLH